MILSGLLESVETPAFSTNVCLCPFSSAPIADGLPVYLTLAGDITGLTAADSPPADREEGEACVLLGLLQVLCCEFTIFTPAYFSSFLKPHQFVIALCILRY